ncbi:AraC family transcriptional regulator [Amycolatopsis acidiphila]|uniref:AraC family transcriptional regulator n=1 Tax=Amycolatopsis acidiphila TaxID=715473 RepID=A0A558ADM7_9PSEU|nr:AraC family transcriptional regulator [Amycolatopsis acidiphila]TVT22378.1 AraC family transcriptional regulator [Amycolatopsis acidiphila]UIJ57575.1 AraC family transcriptional regulator [Amycolatopsis acidiphila]GHG89588.1 transcriptional regulator [Amycolatopsis acidiphila]
MTQAANSLEERITSGDLVAELLARAPDLGANSADWPGLTVYRFAGPVAPAWEEVQSLSLCVVAQGRKCVTVDGVHYHYDPFHYLVLNSHLHFTAEIVEASAAKPFVSFVLQIDPAAVRAVSVEMLERRRAAEGAARPMGVGTGQAFVSALDRHLLGAVLRFLRSLSSGADRRVLAPAYLREIVYRVLQADQYARLLQIASYQENNDPVTRVVAYVRAHLAEPLTVADLAEHVSLSPSVFTAQFRETAGRSPYQFVKEMRLNKARELLVTGGATVAGVSRAVGYPNPSHFITEFRKRFGMSPRAYCDFTQLSSDLTWQHVDRS